MGYIPHRAFESLQSLSSNDCKTAVPSHKISIRNISWMGSNSLKALSFICRSNSKFLMHHLSNWKFGSTSLSTNAASCCSRLCIYKAMQVYSKPGIYISLEVDLCFSNFLFEVRKILIFNKKEIWDFMDSMHRK